MTAVATRRLIAHDTGAGLRAGADVPGAVLVTGALMLAVYTIVKPAAEDGWGAASTLVCGAVALVLLAAFVAREAWIAAALVGVALLVAAIVVPRPAREAEASAQVASAAA